MWPCLPSPHRTGRHDKCHENAEGILQGSGGQGQQALLTSMIREDFMGEVENVIDSETAIAYDLISWSPLQLPLSLLTANQSVGGIPLSPTRPSRTCVLFPAWPTP